VLRLWFKARVELRAGVKARVEVKARLHDANAP